MGPAPYFPPTNYKRKHWKRSEMEMNGRNSDDQAEDVSGDFVLIDTY